LTVIESLSWCLRQVLISVTGKFLRRLKRSWQLSGGKKMSKTYLFNGQVWSSFLCLLVHLKHRAPCIWHGRPEFIIRFGRKSPIEVTLSSVDFWMWWLVKWMTWRGVYYKFTVKLIRVVVKTRSWTRCIDNSCLCVENLNAGVIWVLKNWNLRFCSM